MERNGGRGGGGGGRGRGRGGGGFRGGGRGRGGFRGGRGGRGRGAGRNRSEPLELPETIKQEIAEGGASTAADGKPVLKKWKRSQSRKERRKKERVEKKKKRNQFNQRRSLQQRLKVAAQQEKETKLRNEEANAENEEDEEEQQERVEGVEQTPAAATKKRKAEEMKTETMQTTKKKPKQQESKLEAEMKARYGDPQEEYLQYVESKLKKSDKEKKRLRNEMANDGLDSIFEGLRESESDDDDVENEDHVDGGEEADADELSAEESNEENENDADELDADDDDLDEQELDDDEDEEDEEDEDDPYAKDYMKLTTTDIYGRDLYPKEEEEAEEEENEEEQEAKAAEKEAINSVGNNKYVPPSLRRQLQATAEKKKANETNKRDERLVKQIRGLLNRVSNTNLEPISQALDNVFSEHSTNEVTEILTEAILFDLSEAQHKGAMFVLIYAALIAILHNLVGMEVGGYFLEKLALSLMAHIKSKPATSSFSSEESEEGGFQKMSNTVLMFVHLYNFHVLHSGIIYDLIKLLVDSFTENDIELLLSILKNCGTQLRSDDPQSLKEVILMVQEKAAALSKANKHNEQTTEEAMTVDPKTNMKTKTLEHESEEKSELKGLPSRVRFMLEAIYDLKNNKQRASDDANIERITQFRNSLRKLLAKGTSKQLKIPWSDLVSSKKRGRWWLVGSAWAAPQEAEQATATKSALKKFDNELLVMAAQHRMTTDIRKAVFCILMSSEDYMDAFEKLLKLNLKSKQDREIVYVLMHCCAHERLWNEYYAHLASKLCSFNYNYKFTFQYSFWDKFKLLSNDDSNTKEQQLNTRVISNLAHLLAHLMASFSLSLSMLKVLELDKLITKKAVLFFHIFFTTLLTEFSESKVTMVMKRITGSFELSLLRDQLVVFLDMMKAKTREKIKKKAKEQKEEAKTEGEEDTDLLLLTRIKIARRILRSGNDFAFE
ncbi:Nucleolar MIF4G domain-containing protein 1 [Balamuthia mandrillaris]